MSHPDEGTIHAWLDGALTPEEAQTFEAHIASCPACAAAVANARGVLAAASRILSALDNVPAGVIPGSRGTGAPRANSGARDAKPGGRFRATRWRAAAAIVVVAGASWLVLNQRTDDVNAVRQQASETMATADTVSSPDQQQSANAERVTANLPAAEPASKPLRTAQTRATVGDVSGLLRGATSAPPSSAGTGSGAVSAAAPHPAQPGSRTELSKVANTPRVASDPIRAEKAVRSEMAVRQQSTEMRQASRQNIDSILAADSASAFGYTRLEGQLGSLSNRAADAVAQSAPSMQSGSAKRAATVPASPRLAAPMSVSDRAAGCYVLAITPGRLDSLSGRPVGLLPEHLELRRTLGVSGDEQGNNLARPGPGEPPLRPGAVGFWKPLGADKIRVTFADDTSWVVLTLEVMPDAVSGPARRWSASTARLESVDVRGRRAVCTGQ